MNYAEKLQDPRWQRKRLDILNRDSFTCQECFSTTKTLHVHHLDYEDDSEPWDYPDFYLITLCKDCHESVTYKRKERELDIIKKTRLALKDMFILNCAVDVITQHQSLHRLFFLLWDIGEDVSMNLLEAEYTEMAKRAIIKHADNGGAFISLCFACGGKMEMYEKYGYAKCNTCGFYLKYNILTDGQTT